MAELKGTDRVVIEGVAPEIDCGRFAVKRTLGESVTVEADAFTDGHDALAAVILSRHEEQSAWQETPMRPVVNDRWRGTFPVERIGKYVYTVRAWVDRFASWRRDLHKRIAAGQKIDVDLQLGTQLIDEAARQATGDEREELQGYSSSLGNTDSPPEIDVLLNQEPLGELMARHLPRKFATTYPRELSVLVERERARWSAWYEMFPRSCSGEPGRHGTFRDCEARLPDIAAMGFDVLYLPPIHPIGHTHRKGKNNSPNPEPEDVGSPWAIGAEAGGHKSIHPELGTLEDFRRLVASAKEQGVEIALDVALQCSPDHPYVREHPEWFRHRPDGSIQYAENPPKKYEDIYPLDFQCADWQALWHELKSIFDFWIAQGVQIFRVDNPHTKPFDFWEWAIAEIKREHPDCLFLSEAFTRPKVMYRLAKLGFTQSYTYFAWRRTKGELMEYLTEVTRPPVADFFRPSLWPNTPDILTDQLQTGGRPMFMSRLVLAATLGASYGIYGPAFELCEGQPREFGSEEYRDSEKYQLRHWPLDAEDSLQEFIALVNRIRRENPALANTRSLEFHRVDNEELLCYSKRTDDLSNIIVVVVSLDPHYTQSGFVELPLAHLGLDEEHPYQMHDLLGGGRYLWHGRRNYTELNPHVVPAHIFRLRRHVRTEQDFEYFL